MESKYSIPLSFLIKEFQLTEIYLPDSADNIQIRSPEISRPGLAFAGFTDLFDSFRIQIIGRTEHRYLFELSDEERRSRLEAFFKLKPIAIVISTRLGVFDEMKEFAEKYGVAILETAERTSSFMAALIASLNTNLAPRVTRHGVLVEVYGEGLLILGDSGIGKSETAIELVKRGHRLIADDAVEIKRVSA